MRKGNLEKGNLEKSFPLQIFHSTLGGVGSGCRMEIGSCEIKLTITSNPFISPYPLTPQGFLLQGQKARQPRGEGVRGREEDALVMSKIKRENILKTQNSVLPETKSVLFDKSCPKTYTPLSPQGKSSCVVIK